MSAVVALKRAGFSLKQIRQVLADRHVDLAALVAAQLAEIDARAAEIAEARLLLRSVQSRIDRGEPIDVATLCSLIRSGDKMMEQQDLKAIAAKYFTPQQQAEWAEAQSKLPPDHLAKLDALKARIAAQLPLDPASQKAQTLFDEWVGLTCAYKDAVAPKTIVSLRKIEAALTELPEAPVFAFLKDASRARGNRK